MSTDDFLTVNERIVADDFEDEMVLIDVHKGLYFSMRGSAKEIWKAFKDSQSRSALLGRLADQHGEDSLQSINQAIDRMVEHELLISGPPPKNGVPVLHGLTVSAFIAPIVDVFTDMAELIAIDPVHEVDEAAGWPVRPANFPAQA